jgi:hypothetical protein
LGFVGEGIVGNATKVGDWCRKVGRALSLAILSCLYRICIKYEAQHELILMENPIKCNYLIVLKLFFHAYFLLSHLEKLVLKDILNS